MSTPSSSSSTPIRIQLLSDIHLEHPHAPNTEPYVYSFPRTAPNLALLGDIGNTKDDALFGWLDEQLGRYERVFFLGGNHEPYGSSLEESHNRLLEYAATRAEPVDGRSQFIYLHRTRYDLSPTLTLLGCTLWSAIDPQHASAIASFSPDFKYTHSFDLAAYALAHQADITWLEHSITSIRSTEPEREIVIFTHHAPTFHGTQDPKFHGGPGGSAFSTELTEREWWGPPLKVWGFGHTHWTCDLELKGVRVVSNQRGYVSDAQRGFEVGKVLEL